MFGQETLMPLWRPEAVGSARQQSSSAVGSVGSTVGGGRRQAKKIQSILNSSEACRVLVDIALHRLGSEEPNGVGG